MPERRGQGSFVNPISFLILGGIFLLLPFGAVSCSTDGPSGAGSAQISATGGELLRNTGTTDLSGVFDESKMSASAVADIEHDFTGIASLRWLTIVTVAALGVGFVVALATMQRERMQRIVSLLLAALATTILCVLAVRLVQTWTAAVRDLAGWMVDLPEGQGKNLPGHAGDVVSLGAGFWLSVVGSGLLVLGNTVALLFRKRTP
jgi:hypothetical protein